MTKRPRTPKELAAEQDRKTYSFSLNRVQAEQLKKIADNTGVAFSTLIDEAIKYYLEAIKER